MCYGPKIGLQFRGAATSFDRILKGAKPVALPVERLTGCELIINVKTANLLGLTIAQSVLARPSS